MTTRKTERILNLTICLLVSGRYLPKSRIREAVEGYHDLSDAAFERTFERDKDELRSLGVPIEVGSFDPLFDDEPGYRILPSEFELPPIDLDAEEAAVVGVAARVWQHASMAESTTSAMAKLRAGGSSRTRLSSEPWSRRAGHRIGLRTAVARGAAPDSSVVHLPRRCPPHARAVGDDLSEGSLVRHRSRYRTGRPADVQAVAHPGPAQERFPARRLRSAGKPGRALAGPLAQAARADRVSAAGYPHRQGAGAAAARNAQLADVGAARWIRGLLGRLQRAALRRGRDRPVRRRRHRPRAGGTAERGSPGPGTRGLDTIRPGRRGMTSQAQVRRLLSLVPYLRDHDGARMADVAEAFGISEATLRDDLNVLWMCGMPGLTPGDLIDIDMDAVDGEGVIHLSNADYLTRPLRLSAEEAMALVLGLQTLHEIAGPGEQDAVERALKKLEEAAGRGGRRRPGVGQRDRGSRRDPGAVTDGLARG